MSSPASFGVNTSRKKPLPPDDAAGRRETITKVIDAVNQEHGRPEELVGDARATVENIKKFIREHDVLRLPEPDRLPGYRDA